MNFFLIALLLGVLTPHLAQAQRSYSREIEIKLNKSTIVVESWGEGTPIVLLHGGSGPITGFGGLAPMLAEKGFRVLMINRRGFGGSKGPLDNINLHDYAEDVAGVVKNLVGSPVHILGHAYGNRVARCFSTDYPNLTKTVILLAAGGEVPGEEKAWAALEQLSEPNLSRSEQVKLARASLFSPQAPSSVINRWLDARQVSLDGQAAVQLANRATPLEDWWEAGSSQMLVIQGLDDRIAPPGNGRNLRNRLKGRVTLIDLENAGHAMHVEQPEKIVEHIVRYVGKLKP
ncbi:MAG: hypothetical protein CMD99_08740 [Gammaproteobacteria bacterium]|nr:hypothetical protein [Gammaproteobacteria bacterium]|tara:strand:- start:1702 stop:2565 length:864 start_codon:yes stop_codon:yes gene_type:complete